MPGDDGALSEVVTRLFGNPLPTRGPGNGNIGVDDFPVEEIRASVAAIVASSGLRRGAVEAAEINQIAEANAFPENLEPRALLTLPDQRGHPKAFPPSPGTHADALQERPRTALQREAPRRRRGWMIGLATAAGMGLTALAGFIGLDLVDTGAEDIPRNRYSGADSMAEPRRQAERLEVLQPLVDDTMTRPAFSGDAAVRSGPPHKPVSMATGMPRTGDKLPTLEEPTDPPAPAELPDARIAPRPALPSIKPSARRLAAPAQVALSSGAAPETGRAGPFPSDRPAVGSETLSAVRASAPRRVYPGSIAEGSAAGLTLAMVEASGTELSRAERLDLAMRVEQALETELDGRTARLRVSGRDDVSLAMLSSRQASQSVLLARSEAIAITETGFLVEGGWFAARNPLSVRPLPDVQTEMDGGTAPAGAQFERIATVTSPYGDRWFLVGERGVAQGYVSAGDVVPLGAFDGRVIGRFSMTSREAAPDSVTVQTNCRVISISIDQLVPQPAHVCRNVDGRWLARSSPGVEADAPPIPEDVPTLEALAALDLAADPSRRAEFARQLDALIVEKVEALQLAVPVGGAVIPLEIQPSDHQLRSVPLRRAAEVAAPQVDFTVGHGWVEARRDTQLRPVPSTATRLAEGLLPAGAHMEILGLVGDPDTANWALLGLNGVAQGYASLEALRWRDSETELRFTAFTRAHGRIVQERSALHTQCRFITVSGSEFETCARPDGHPVVGPVGANGRQDPLKVALIP